MTIQETLDATLHTAVSFALSSIAQQVQLMASKSKR